MSSSFITILVVGVILWYCGNALYDMFYKPNKKSGLDGTTEQEIDINGMVEQDFQPTPVNEYENDDPQ